MKFAFLSLVFCLLIFNSNGIRCYQCVSGYYGLCDHENYGTTRNCNTNFCSVMKIDDAQGDLNTTWIRSCGDTLSMDKNQVISVSKSNGAFMFTCACKAELCNGHWDASINGTTNCYPA